MSRTIRLIRTGLRTAPYSTTNSIWTPILVGSRSRTLPKLFCAEELDPALIFGSQAHGSTPGPSATVTLNLPHPFHQTWNSFSLPPRAHNESFVSAPRDVLHHPTFSPSIHRTFSKARIEIPQSFTHVIAVLMSNRFCACALARWSLLANPFRT